ncbi:MAG: bifunctional metallophosphatase/5'-nucleotidase [Pseudomonadota bacterium]
MRLIAGLALCLALPIGLSPPASAEILTILHTNDIHSRIEPVSRFNVTCSRAEQNEGVCFGGAARLKALIDTIRAEVPDLLLLDGGDQFQGSLMYTRYQGQAAAEVMNAIGYDAMTVGNHEFDDGPEVLRAFIDRITFPILMSNADISGDPHLAGVIQPSIVITRGEHRYGIIGLTPEDTHQSSSPGPHVHFHDAAAAVRAQIEGFSAQGIDRIIVLSHSGYRRDMEIAAQVDGIDIIVGGHSHSLLSDEIDGAAGPYPTWVETPSGGRTAIVQAYAYGRYLGRLDVRFDPGGVVTAARGGPIPLTTEMPEDPALAARVATLAEPLEREREMVVAHVGSYIGADHSACRRAECTLGNLVADAMLDARRRFGAQIAIMNGGGLRAPINAGEVTRGDILQLLPFQNTLAEFWMTGADIRAALEHGVSAVEDSHGRFPQVAGLRYAYDPSVAPGQGRIRDVEVFANGRWQPLDGAQTYQVVTNDFLRQGGDGYAVFAERAEKPYDFNGQLSDILEEYLFRRRGYQAYTDGRIEIVSP